MKKEMLFWFPLILILGLFLYVSYLVDIYLPLLQELVINTLLGMLIYMGLVVFEIMLAFVTIVPLIPVATALWGWFLSGLLSLLGWTIGSVKHVLSGFKDTL